MNELRWLWLKAIAAIYVLIRPLIFRKSAQEAHESLLKLLAIADNNPMLRMIADTVHWLSFPRQKITVGGVTLPHTTILAAGFVKGHGFDDEQNAIQAVKSGKNIMPGWRSVPLLMGVVEFGSFTRFPRIGNQGTVIWRDVATKSTQNRVGLKNPGAIAAATFMQDHIADLPHVYGINIAISPGVDDPTEEATHIRESVLAFLIRGVVPNWFTLNISCPNTEDDPTGNQTDQKTRRACQAALSAIEEAGYAVPLWVKISPDLSEAQYHILMDIFAELGVKAIIATNTIGMPTPIDTSITAGVGGGKLFPYALKSVEILQKFKKNKGHTIDLVGCGGIIGGEDYRAYQNLGVQVIEYWSALIYRGPLAGAIIENEGK